MSRCRKSAFSLPSDAHYLNCAYMGPISRRTEAAGVAGVRIKNFPARIASDDFFAPSEAARSAFARLIGTSAERIALIPAVSYGMASVLSNLDIAAGANLVVTAEEFPSNIHHLRHICRHSGAILRTVPRPTCADTQTWSRALCDAMDRDTALITLSAHHWTDGTRFDLMRIAEKARSCNAALVIDGTQSVGAVPFDFDAVAPDALLCAGYKFLLGPYTCGFMVLGDRFADAEPLEHNWINRAQSEDFARLIDYQDAFQPGARRHDFGEHSSTVLVPMLKTALQQLLEWGIDSVSAHCTELFRVLQDGVEDTDYLLPPDGQHDHHLFGIQVPDISSLPALMRRLADAGVQVSIRGDYIRISTHIYNDEQDMLALIRALRS